MEREWVEPITDMNHPDYLSDANLEALGQAASKADWGLGPNESASGTNSIFVGANDRPMPLPEKEQQ